MVSGGRVAHPAATTALEEVAPHLRAVLCPKCMGRVATVILEAGPLMLRHDNPNKGCRFQWVVVPNITTKTVSLTPVQGRLDGDDVLRAAALAWHAERMAHYSRELAERFNVTLITSEGHHGSTV